MDDCVFLGGGRVNKSVKYKYVFYYLLRNLLDPVPEHWRPAEEVMLGERGVLLP